MIMVSPAASGRSSKHRLTAEARELLRWDHVDFGDPTAILTTGAGAMDRLFRPSATRSASSRRRRKESTHEGSLDAQAQPSAQFQS